MIIAFPLHRRRALIAGCVRRMLELRPNAAELHLERLLGTQRDALRRKGVEDARIAAELRGLESAVRAALWQRVLRPDGAA